MGPRREGLIWGLAVGAVVAAAWRLYETRPRERVPGQEGMDDPELAQGFNQVATWPQMRLLRWYLAQRALQMTRHGEAVDLGCGPGHLVLTLAESAPGLRVTGVDLSDEMLAQAEQYARASGARDRISFRKGDAGQIPFSDDSLDLVVSTLSLHHWGDPVAVLDEIDRVLRPGGSLLIFDLRRDLTFPYWMALWFAKHFVVPSAIRRANEPLASRDAAYTPGEAARLAAQSRFSGPASPTRGNWRVTRGPLWLTIEGTKDLPAGPEPGGEVATG